MPWNQASSICFPKIRLKLARGSSKLYTDKIDRRGLYYPEYINTARSKQWALVKKIECLKLHPMRSDRSSEDVLLLKISLASLKAFAQRVISSSQEDADRRDMQKKRWDDAIPWLRLIMCFTNDGVKEQFLIRHSPSNREELDSRGTPF
jgi:hypothetical protein